MKIINAIHRNNDAFGVTTMANKSSALGLLLREIFKDIFTSNKPIESLSALDMEEPRGNIYVRIGGQITSESHDAFLLEVDEAMKHRVFNKELGNSCRLKTKMQ